MKFINRARQTGKSTMMIYASVICDAPIIVKDQVKAHHLRALASELGVCVRIFTLLDWERAKHTREYENVLIDEADYIITEALNRFLNANVLACSFTIPMIESKLDNNKEEAKNE